MDPAALGEGALPLSQADYSFLDRTDRPAVKGFLVLTKLSTVGGNDYFSAVPVVFKTGFARIGMTRTELYYTQFWDAVRSELSFNLPDAEATGRYLSDMDTRIAAEREAAEKRDRSAQLAAARAASEAAYRASPQYAKDTAARAVEACRANIARARAAIAKDDRVAQISGYQNALLRQQAATIIVNCQDTIARGGN